MSWKDAFLNPTTKDTNKTTPVSKKDTNMKFPEPSQSNDFGFGQSNSNQQSGQVSQEYTSKFLDAFENAFSELNQNGYDFFEFFQSIIHSDINNPQSYTMAFAMGKGMDRTITKEKLLSQSEFYITELNKLSEKNINDGNKKKQDLINQKESENQNLTTELSSLKQQLEGIELQIKDRENKLSQIENKYQPKISEYDNKLMANDFAKNKIVSSIETVKQGINQNLK